MNSITLAGLLPEVFLGLENEPRIADSQVWLRSAVTFTRADRVIVEAESGTGKSSLMSFIYGIRSDYAGCIAFDGADTRTLTPDRWCDVRRTQLAWLPQELQLFPELTALENIELKNSLTRHRSSKWIGAAMGRLGIADRADSPAGRMSVGQQQRVAIVRALCQPFSFLLLDEPVSHLDAESNAAVASLVTEAAAEAGASIIVTSVGNPLKLDYTSSLRL